MSEQPRTDPFTRHAPAQIMIPNITVLNNSAQTPISATTLRPSQTAAERVDNDVISDIFSYLDFTDNAISGDSNIDIGIYLKDSRVPLTSGCIISPIAVPILVE